MLTSLKESGYIHASGHQHTDPFDLIQELERLFSRSKATGYVQWRMADDESLSIIRSSVELDAGFYSRSMELAEATIRTSQRQSCVLASPSFSIIIAAPIPTISSDCLCVRFRCEQTELNEQSVALRSALVAQAAAAIASIVASPLRSPHFKPSHHPTSDHPPLHLPALDHSTSQHQPAAETLSASVNVAMPGSLPSWPELANLVKKKLLAFLAQFKSNPKLSLGTLCAVAGVCALPWPHSIQCNVICEPVLRRYVAAPFDAKLLRSHVVVGQQVLQGELLATLDGGDLISHLASVRAKLGQAEQRELAALSAGDHSKSGIERLEVEHLRREAELLERRQGHLEVRSPIDGVVVAGDLERAEGAPLSVGENLFEIASLDKLVAEVAVPEHDIAFVKNEMPVSIVMEAIAGTRFQSSIQRIHLRNEIRDNESVFIAEAELANPEALLRPGMNAKATVDAGYRAIGWQLFRTPVNVARQWIGW